MNTTTASSYTPPSRSHDDLLEIADLARAAIDALRAAAQRENYDIRSAIADQRRGVTTFLTVDSVEGYRLYKALDNLDSRLIRLGR